jgi:dipeptidase E
MKKLFLTSDGLSSRKLIKEAKKLLEKPVDEAKALIVYTLRKKSYIKYVRKVKKQLLRLGMAKKNILYANISKNAKKPKIDFDILYSCGGNTFYILDRIRKTGFDRVIRNFVNKGGLYIGVSAGSIIVHKTIKGIDKGIEGDPNDIGLKNLNGLGLTRIAIFPHYKNKFKADVLNFGKIVNYPVVALRDKQGLLILGNKAKKI